MSDLAKLRDSRRAPGRSRGVLSDLRDTIAAAAQGYWDRQGRLAREGMAMAEHGAQAVRGGDPMGAIGMFAGPAGYLSSPITALVPTEDEVYNSPDVPSWAAPAVAGTLQAMAMGLPGNKAGMKPRGLSRGLSDLAKDATDAERVALQQRLAAEAGQAGGVPSAVTRDQALANLTQAAPEGIIAYHGSPQLPPQGMKPWAKPQVNELSKGWSTPHFASAALEDAGIKHRHIHSNAEASLSQYLIADDVKDASGVPFKVRISDHDYLAPSHGVDIRYGEDPGAVDRQIKSALGIYEHLPTKTEPTRLERLRPQIELWAARLGMNSNLQDVQRTLAKAIDSGKPTRKMREWSEKNPEVAAQLGPQG